MHTVVPALIPQSSAHLATTVATLSTFAPEVQIDVTDGLFTETKSWPYTETPTPDVRMFPALADVPFELDLMIAHPESTLDAWMALAPVRIVVHVESTVHLDAVCRHRAAHGYRLGLAFNNDTDLGLLQQLDRSAYDYVQLMGIAHIGEQGQSFDERVLARIHEVQSRYPDLTVSIDGSVNTETLPLLAAAGADRFVVGSAILQAENPRVAYENLVRIATHG